MTNEERKVDRHLEPDSNPDPITGQPGAHPVGTGIGAAAAGTIGTAIGAAGGPVGAVIGAAVGSVIGGLTGKAVAESIDPTVEDNYWRDNYVTRPYATPDRTYDDYQPAYRTGYEGYGRYSSRPYSEVEPELKQHYETNYGASKVQWNQAKYAVQDAWDRVRNNSMYHDQDEYWRQHYATSPYYESGLTYADYQPAYRLGYEAYSRYEGSNRTYDEVEPELRQEYERNYSSSLGWEKAKYAVRDAWDRVKNAIRH
ncbi:hypothetical protein ACN4EK_06570 [Pantanalinema rosaneae CENA516]|uniref:hypothetical protein n=1 Tax=Pantanalinema rosaneae TaxID=1620701 RepID=UPI003D6E2D71